MIRETSVNDWERIYYLLIEDIKEHQKFNPKFYELNDEIRNALKEQIKFQLKDDNNVLFVKCFEDEIVGFIRFIKKETYAEIGDIFVKENFRRRGYAKELCMYGLEKFKSVKLVTLRVQKGNDSAIEFYKSLGFDDYSINMKLDL